jgi:hypothetical protein
MNTVWRHSIQLGIPLLLLAGCGARTDLEESLPSDLFLDGGPDGREDRTPPEDAFLEGPDFDSPDGIGDAFEEFDAVEEFDALEDFDAEDGGECPVSTSGFTPMTYTPAVAHQGLCSSTQIQAFVDACGDTGSNTSCNDWFMTNVSEDGGTGTPCGNCILAPDNNGGLWLDPDGFFEPDYAACIQLTDTTNGNACASAYDDAQGCNGVACDACTTDDSYSACIMSVDGTAGGCASFVAAEEKACKADLADGGAASTCSPGAAMMALNPDYTFIISLICGS